MERLKHMKENLMSCVEGQMGDLRNADSKELGEAVDMIKDLSEAIYYCSIVKAMEESEKKEKYERHYYIPYPKYPREDPPMMYYPREPREPIEDPYMMYYPRNRREMDNSFAGARYRNPNMERDGARYDEEYPVELRDNREGRAGRTRKMYMQSKELHKDKNIKMQELEQYMRELSEDITEMIQDATPEEKQLLEKKIATLAAKVSQVNV